MRFFALFIFIFVFMGCSHYEWVNPNRSQRQFYADKIKWESLASTVAVQKYRQENIDRNRKSIYKSGTEKLSEGLNNLNKKLCEKRLFKDCMRGLGYEKKEVEKQ